MSGSCEVPFSPWQAKQVGSRASSGCAPTVCAAKPARIAPTARLRMSLTPTLFTTNGPGARAPGPDSDPSTRGGGAGVAAGAHPPDRTVPVVGDQHRPVLHHHHVHRTPDIAVVLEKAGEERLDRPCGAVLLDVHE